MPDFMPGNNPFGAFFNGNGAANWNQSFADAILSGMPEATYMSAPGGQTFGAQSPRKGRYFQQAYQDVYGQYLGQLGTALREGKQPTSFRDFLDTDPWTKRYSQLPQYERGVTKTYSDPRTRFIFY